MDSIYWIWLSLALGTGAKTKTLLEFFGSPEEIYRCGEVDLYLCPFLSPNRVEKILNTKIGLAEEIAAQCRKNRWQILTPDAPSYPQRLKELEDYPAVLYQEGTLPVFDDEVAVSIVGTREATRSGVAKAYELAFGIAKAGGLVISGGALGIDTAAHKGALAGGGKTVAILGNGLGHTYLPQNKKLRELIAANGALLTENPPFTSPTKYTFPVRNRIISGLSLGTVVVEAGVKSGSLLTASHAKSQGRDLFAVPSEDEYGRSHFGGSAKLIRSGAKPVSCAADILEEYTSRYPQKISVEKSKGNPLKRLELPKNLDQKEDNRRKTEKTVQNPVENVEESALSASEMDIYNSLRKTSYDPDELAALLGMEIRDVMTALLDLEIKGYITNNFGKKYTLV